ncbi:MAG: tRNA modification GTPase MnmE [delta proteobacterium ML8_F1]|nr:MAG: tRNA modification GTPase MnmE [delta proteobacterium ML8_F1]
MNDTIVAIGTPIGESAIGIIRLSGEDSVDLANRVFKPKVKGKLTDYPPKTMVYGHIVEGDTVIDEVLGVYMRGPKTYTREDMVEINCHGGIVPLNRVLALLLSEGARMAQPGEFTQRAFLSGRLDLAQAEAVMDMVSAKTPQGFDVAFNQLEGYLSKKVKQLRDRITEIMAQIEVGIDYPEEDITEITYHEIDRLLDEVVQDLTRLLENSQTGKVLREGLQTVIVGKPNVGKSSLMNALLRESRAIVTDIPGTTRDIIEEHLNIRGIPLKIVDTAGIRETEDIIEKIGVERTKDYFNRADLIILVLSGAETITEEEMDILELIRERNALVLINKTDLPLIIEEKRILEKVPEDRLLKVSITREHGLDALEDRIVDMVYGGRMKGLIQSPLISNVRHISAVEKALRFARDAKSSVLEGLPYDFVEVDIKNIYDALGEISGDTIEEDVISKIFSNFCLGK